MINRSSQNPGPRAWLLAVLAVLASKLAETDTGTNTDTDTVVASTWHKLKSSGDAAGSSPYCM